MDENEENEKLLDEYKQIASEGKETSMISKGKINKKFQNEEKDKEKSRMRTTLIGKEREIKHKLAKQKIEFEKERIQAEERKLKMTMEERLKMEKLTLENIKVEMHEKIAIMNETGNNYKMKGKLIL